MAVGHQHALHQLVLAERVDLITGRTKRFSTQHELDLHDLPDGNLLLGELRGEVEGVGPVELGHSYTLWLVAVQSFGL